jgi:hypothetical protein
LHNDSNFALNRRPSRHLLLASRGSEHRNKRCLGEKGAGWSSHKTIFEKLQLQKREIRDIHNIWLKAASAKSISSSEME